MILGHENRSKLKECLIFTHSHSNCLTWYQKLWYENYLLNFSCHTPEFHNRWHAIVISNFIKSISFKIFMLDEYFQLLMLQWNSSWNLQFMYCKLLLHNFIYFSFVNASSHEHERRLNVFWGQQPCSFSWSLSCYA